jgi:nucleoside-triphosphatase THEP1
MGQWSAVVGRSKSEKDRIALGVAQGLAQRGIRVGGFVQLRSHDAEGELAGWDVCRVSDGTRYALARRSNDPDLCSYRFDDEGFALAKAWSRAEPAEVIFIGGVGKLEAAERGHWPVLSELVERADGPLVVACIRDTSLATIALRLPDPVEALELPAEEDVVRAFTDAIAERVLESR